MLQHKSNFILVWVSVWRVMNKKKQKLIEGTFTERPRLWNVLCFQIATVKFHLIPPFIHKMQTKAFTGLSGLWWNFPRCQLKKMNSGPITVKSQGRTVKGGGAKIWTNEGAKEMEDSPAPWPQESWDPGVPPPLSQNNINGLCTIYIINGLGSSTVHTERLTAGPPNNSVPRHDFSCPWVSKELQLHRFYLYLLHRKKEGGAKFHTSWVPIPNKTEMETPWKLKDSWTHSSRC